MSACEQVPVLAALMQAMEITDSESAFMQHATQDAELRQLSNHSTADKTELLEVGIQGCCSSEAVLRGLRQRALTEEWEQRVLHVSLLSEAEHAEQLIAAVQQQLATAMKQQPGVPSADSLEAALHSAVLQQRLKTLQRYVDGIRRTCACPPTHIVGWDALLEAHIDSCWSRADTPSAGSSDSSSSTTTTTLHWLCPHPGCAVSMRESVTATGEFERGYSSSHNHPCMRVHHVEFLEEATWDGYKMVRSRETLWGTSFHCGHVTCPATLNVAAKDCVVGQWHVTSYNIHNHPRPPLLPIRAKQLRTVRQLQPSAASLMSQHHRAGVAARTQRDWLSFTHLRKQAQLLTTREAAAGSSPRPGGSSGDSSSSSSSSGGGPASSDCPPWQLSSARVDAAQACPFDPDEAFDAEMLAIKEASLQLRASTSSGFLGVTSRSNVNVACGVGEACIASRPFKTPEAAAMARDLTVLMWQPRWAPERAIALNFGVRHYLPELLLAEAPVVQDALGPEDIRAWFREQEQHSWAEFLQPTRQAPPPKEQQHTESFAQQLKAALAAVVDGVAPPGWIWVECEQPECKQWRLLTVEGFKKAGLRTDGGPRFVCSSNLDRQEPQCTDAPEWVQTTGEEE